jgi:hypothetical protein
MFEGHSQSLSLVGRDEPLGCITGELVTVSLKLN